MGDFVVMPNHVHALVSPMSGCELEHILQSIKRHSSREIGKCIKRAGSLWQRDTYDHIVRDVEQLRAFRKYIFRNPGKAKLRTGEYAYCQAEWLEEIVGFEE